MAKKLMRQRCIYCGHPNPEDARDCRKCGKEIGPLTPAPSAISKVIGKTKDPFLGPSYMRILIILVGLILLLTIWILLTVL